MHASYPKNAAKRNLAQQHFQLSTHFPSPHLLPTQHTATRKQATALYTQHLKKHSALKKASNELGVLRF
uniref:Uncharacterized protein n=1 Tax=Desertifilum tharense IPPAS B-1220 TaxID=1781255 RepID=A0ACD5GZY7_9CYAN